MKKIYIVLVAILVAASFSLVGKKDLEPDAPEKYFGMWAYGDAFQTGITTKFNYLNGIKGIHLIVNSGDIRPVSNGAFYWTSLDNVILAFKAQGYQVGLQLMFGQGVSADLLDSNQTSVIVTQRNQQQPKMVYPDYFSQKYQDFFYSTLQGYINHLAEPNLRDAILYVMLVEGSTGDADPYKGKRVDGKPEILESDWVQFRQSGWQAVKGYIAASAHPELQVMINPGNDESDTKMIDDVMGVGNWWSKKGTLSHDILFNAENSYYSRAFQIARGEWQGYVPDYSTHKNKEGFALIASALTGKLAFLNMTQVLVTNDGQNGLNMQNLVNFFNKYAYISPANEKGFIVPYGKVDFADTVRFDQDVYGRLFNGSGVLGDRNDSLYQFNKYINRLSLQYTDVYDDFMNYKTETGIAKYISWQRVLNIRNAFPSLGFAKREYDQYGNEMKNNTAGDPANSWEDDFIVCGHPNWGRNITLVDQYNSTQDGARIGPDTSMLGRFCAKGNFKLDFNTTNNVGQDTVRVTIHYFDQSSFMPSIPFGYQGACQDFVNLFTIPITNTGQWKSKTFDITNYPLKANSFDFILNSADVWIGLVEYEIRKKV